MKLLSCFFFFFFSLTALTFTAAQYTPQEEAIKLFDEKEYSEALPIFKRLTTLFPKDPRYQYYAGVCMVQSNTNLDKAIEHLTLAAEKTVPRNVYFFLGKALLYQYKFDKALDAFLRFQQFADRADKELWQSDMHIAMARNGNRLLEKECVINVYKTDTINEKDLYIYYNRLINSGKFQEVADRSFLFGNSNNHSTWRFMPTLLDKSEPVYESSTGVARKNRDLVMMKKNADDSWSRPENLGSVINSPYDEDYAYFNTSESVLYFASKGHNSMGGYDVFKAAYNPNTKIWSAPENLGYPINTPYNDFLFVPSNDQSQAYIASNRATHNEKVVVYTISFKTNYVYRNLLENVDYSAAANIKVTSKPTVSAFKNETKSERVISSTKNSVKSSSTNNFPTELFLQNDYNEQLNNALQFQLKSDSLSRVAEDLRQNAISSKNDSEKDRLQKEIYSLEQRSKAMQQKADSYYEKARVYELQYAQKNESAKQPPTISNDKVRKAFKTNELNSTQQSSDKIVSSQTSTTDGTMPKVVYDFKVMAKSPYTAANQIPINQSLPSQLIYRVQLGAFSKPIEPDKFKGIVPISAETLQNVTVTKYYAGYFNRFTDAEKALNKIKELGIKDSYIVSFFDGKSIPINRAREIESDK